MNPGKMARLVVGNVDVLVGSNRSQTLDAQLFLLPAIAASITEPVRDQVQTMLPSCEVTTVRPDGRG